MEFESIQQAGVIVIEVPHLRARACYVADQSVALVRAGLDAAEREHAARWLMGQVTQA